MARRRFVIVLIIVAAFIAMAAFPPSPQYWGKIASNGANLIIGQNVNMVSGNTYPGGDPYLQRQNEPSIAVSTRNPLHLLAGANDYRPVDFPDSEGDLPGQEPGTLANNADAWLGVFKSFNGGQSWTSTLLPGCKHNPLDPGSSPLYGFSAAADPTVRAGANGMFYYSGIAFDRIKNGRSVLFIARFIDNNNLGYINLNNPQAMDSGAVFDSIKYIDTSIIDEGTSGQFADKPWIAVDIPRNNHPPVSIGGPDIPGQQIPAHNMYIIYSIFLGSEASKTHNKILFARSTNCGATWQGPIKLSEGEHVNQGTTLAISPKDGTIYAAWRRFASNNQSDAILVCKSTDQGQSFTKPIEIPSSYPIAPYDQFTDIDRFRTSAFPTMAVDSNGVVYLAWSDKGLAGYYGRIVMTTSIDGISWSNPAPIINDNEVGNQIMPSMTYGAGKLMLTWFDSRFSLGGLESPIEDDYDANGLATQRHTMDVFVARANPLNPGNWNQSTVHTFSNITKVSRYLFSGEVINGQIVLHQLQSNHPNYPMFMGGTVPFHGDYLDITPSPMFLPMGNGMWRFNTGYTGFAGNTGYAQSENVDWILDPANFHITWTDNRDVKRPDPDRYDLWTTYNKPGGNVDCDATGMRDQNVYTSQVSHEGVIIGSPGNTKPFTAEDIFDPNTGVTIPVADQDRTFLIFIKNLTDIPTRFLLTLYPPIDPNTNLPALNASFWQFDPPPAGGEKHEIVVDIDPYSSITLTVFVDCVDASHPYRHASLKVKVEEIGNFIEGEWTPVSGGFAGFVLLNPDPVNTAMIDYNFQEIHTPGLESFIPDDLYVSSPYSDLLDIQLYDPEDPGIYDVNPDIIHNPHIRSPHIRSNSLVNPHIRSTNLGDINFGDVYDLQWNFSNNGDTTSAYSFTPFGEQLPELGDPEYVESQLLIYRVY
ncbi:MAG: sialidase family protein, partial [Candidatus Aminicenantes bacterium]